MADPLPENTRSLEELTAVIREVEQRNQSLPDMLRNAPPPMSRQAVFRFAQVRYAAGVSEGRQPRG